MKHLLFLAVFFFLFPVFFLPSMIIEEDDPVSEENVINAETEDLPISLVEDLPLHPHAAHIEMDIRTSSLRELAQWNRDLGLSEGGSRDELAARLRVHYGLPTPRPVSTVGQRIITIESAMTTEYFTIDIVNEEYARLTGDVVVSLRDGNTIHRIQAWEILYNRTRNVLSATGDVVYIREEGNTIETFRGGSITVNLDNWSSIFIDGATERAVAGRASTYRFAGTVISRTEEEVTVLTRAEITNPANQEAFWSLNASRLWLLPGNDWAVLNAVLRVGNIPVLYLPFFFYPADQIVFHPVLGVRTRAGTFLQTTTYILGRPRSTGIAENSITRIFAGDDDDSDLVREGIFLRTTGERVMRPGATRLSLLFDIYSNLGAYLGAELGLPSRGIFRDTNISAGLGLSRNLYRVGGGNVFTPFPGHDGVSEWNSSRLIFTEVPFRYRLRAQGSFRLNHGTMNWLFPFFSDPYVDRDFMQRSEALDWLGMLRGGATVYDGTEVTVPASYEWRISGSLNPPVRRFNPFINTLTVSNINSSMLFNRRISASYTGPTNPANPGRSFYFPHRFTMFSASAAMTGTPLRTGAAPVQQVGPQEAPPGDALLPDLPISPWAGLEEEDLALRILPDTYTFTPPVLNQTFTLPLPSRFSFTVDYRLAPTTGTELQFRSSAANWREVDDINWSEVSTIQSTFRTDANLNFNLSHAAYGVTVGFSGTGSWRDFLFLNEAAEEFAAANSVRSARNSAFNATYVRSAWNVANTFRPFFLSPVWGTTNFQHSVAGLLARTDVDVSGLNPQWDWVLGNDVEHITRHQTSANFVARVRDVNQNLNITAELPPTAPSIAGNAAFRAGISETTMRGRVLFPYEGDEARNELIVDPFHFMQSFRLGPRSSFRQELVYDPREEIDGFASIISSLSLGAFSTSFSALNAQPWRFNFHGSIDPNLPDGWVQMPDRGLHPHQFRMGFVRTYAQTNLWGNRLSFSFAVNTDLTFDLQRYTNSAFTFGLRARTTITNFLDLDISTSSENRTVFKYFQRLPVFNVPTNLYPGQETNLLIDLLNSFRFDNPELRRRSGFNLRAVNMSMIHHLGDWNARLTVRTTPFQVPGTNNFRFGNEVLFLVQWVPIAEIRTELDYSPQRPDRLIVR